MKAVKKIVPNVLIVLIGLVYLSPFYIILVNSFKDRAEMNRNVLALPAQFTLEYYTQAMEKMNFFRSLLNSLKVTGISVILIVVFASMCAWMLARTKTRYSQLILGLFVATMIIPFQSIMMPLMTWMGQLKTLTGFPFVGSHAGLIFMNLGFGSGMAVFLYHGFVGSVPISVEEAATIDGCNKFQTFWRVVFPMLKPITMTVIILNIISFWNDYLLPSLVLPTPALRTIPLATFYFFGQFTIQWNLSMAGLILTMIPVLLFYIFSQKYIIQGIASGAVKS